jgi:hypothetical protein
MALEHNLLEERHCGSIAVVEEVARMMVVGKLRGEWSPLALRPLEPRYRRQPSPMVDVSFQLSASPTSRQVFK